MSAQRVSATSFVEERLVQAREVAGVSVASLARLLDTSRQTITNYESGRTTPKLEVIQQFADILQQDVAYFYTPLPDLQYDFRKVNFRDRVRNTKSNQLAAGRHLEMLQEYLLEILRYVKIPEVHPERLDMPPDPGAIGSDLIRAEAMRMRDAWGLGREPIRDLVRACERNGIIIQMLSIDNESLDALSTWSSVLERPTIILNDQKGSSVRSRFDLGHELGHMWLHGNIPLDQKLDRKVHKKLEDQANEFSAWLLMPSESWGWEVGRVSLARLQDLKPRWKASIGAQVRHAWRVGLISEGRYRDLAAQMGKRGWRREEPLDRVLDHETPSLLRGATEMIATKGANGLATITHRLPFRTFALSRFAGVPDDYFRHSSPPITLREGSSGVAN